MPTLLRESRIRRYRDRYFPRGTECWVSRDCCALLFSVRGGFLLGGLLHRFRACDAASQTSEIWKLIHERNDMKPKSVSSSSGSRTHADPGELLAPYPSLSEFLTCAAYEDGSRRESPTLTLWATSGQWKLSVKDRAESLVMWLSAASLQELLQMAELFVLEESAPWRHDDQASPDKGKRVRK